MCFEYKMCLFITHILLELCLIYALIWEMNIHETKSCFPQPRNVFALGQVHVSISQGCFSSLVPQVSFEVCSQVFNLPHCYCKYGFFYYCVLWWSIYIYLHTLNTNSLRDILVQTSLQLILLFNLICFLELSKNKWLCEGFKLWFMSHGG